LLHCRSAVRHDPHAQAGSSESIKNFKESDASTGARGVVLTPVVGEARRAGATVPQFELGQVNRAAPVVPIAVNSRELAPN